MQLPRSYISTKIFPSLTTSPLFAGSSSSNFIAKRYLGNAARGPTNSDVFKHWIYCNKLFKERALSYNAFKQRCESFRLFAFWGTVLFLTIDLIVRPLKSTYWKQYSISNWPSIIGGMLQKPVIKPPFEWSKEEVEAAKQTWESYTTIAKRM